VCARDCNRLRFLPLPLYLVTGFINGALFRTEASDVGFSLAHVVPVGQLWWDVMTATFRRMTTTRRRKAFRIVRKLCDVSHRLPSVANAAFFLRNAVRFERAKTGRSPFAARP
jgi:hypothetical protein